MTPIPDRICLECNKPFIADDEKDKFCSEDCMQEWERDDLDDEFEENDDDNC